VCTALPTSLKWEDRTAEYNGDTLPEGKAPEKKTFKAFLESDLSL
jgi:hypothetical protein